MQICAFVSNTLEQVSQDVLMNRIYSIHPTHSAVYGVEVIPHSPSSTVTVNVTAALSLSPVLWGESAPRCRQTADNNVWAGMVGDQYSRESPLAALSIIQKS